MRQQYPQPASAASRAGRKSAKALVRASSLAMQNWSKVCTRDAITCTLTALLSSPNRFRKGLQAENLCMLCPGRDFQVYMRAYEVCMTTFRAGME